MRQIFLLILLFIVGQWLVKALRRHDAQASQRTGARRWRRRRRRGHKAQTAARVRAKAPQLAEPMIRCAECGVHAPKSDSRGGGRPAVLLRRSRAASRRASDGPRRPMSVAFTVDADGWVSRRTQTAVAEFRSAARRGRADADRRPQHQPAARRVRRHGDRRTVPEPLDCDAHPYYDTHLRGVRVSAHFVIHRDGALEQYVSCNERAWHAGASNFFGRERCNDFSIGIELEGSDTTAFEAAQYAHARCARDGADRPAIRSTRSPVTRTSRPAARPIQGPISSGSVCSATPRSRISTSPISSFPKRRNDPSRDFA